MATKTAAKTPHKSLVIPIGKSVMCPIELLNLDLDNPRLQTGSDLAASSETEVIESLSQIAALDELVTSICTNTYLNLEPLIVIGSKDAGPFKVLEGNRRLAAIKLILNPDLAEDLGVKVPSKISKKVLDSFSEVLVNRVARVEDAREFIGFKHINGPQRWDAYAKAKYVANWYKSSFGEITIDEIAAKMGDNNNTLRAYIYAILMLDQAKDAKVWSLDDRPIAKGRFGFSHLYTAIGREEFQEFLGLTNGWSSTPPLKPITKPKLKNLGEVLGYLYGSISDDRASLIKSQNPDLKDIGLAIANSDARLVLKNRGSLDDARDALKNPSDAFLDALVAASLRLTKAVNLLAKYPGKNPKVEALVEEIFENADTLKVMIARKSTRGLARGN
ncbi:MAG: hypothetical protein WBK51_12705 [Polaromonas sp.]